MSLDCSKSASDLNMNFLDTYDIPRSTTPNPNQSTSEQPSLNEEVNQMIGQLGRFWGGFRKQVPLLIHSCMDPHYNLASKESNRLGSRPKRFQ